jgi:GDP-L-fucose synthase
MMRKDATIFVAGHLGLVGSALWRALLREGYSRLLGRTRAELDLQDGAAVRDFFRRERPEYVFLAAAKVGGIQANRTYPADFLIQNLQIQNSVIQAAHLSGVRKLLFLGSSCIYPRLAPQPLTEDALLTGSLEPTNEGYAVAKIAGIKLCQAFRRQHGDDFISAMPTNLYGPRDNYDLENSHVLPALIRRFHEAKRDALPEVVLWGTGSPRREFLHADDLAGACLFLMEHYSDEAIINVGSGQEVTIGELAELIQAVVGYRGRLKWDPTRPDGTPRKRLDNTRLAALGWQPSIGLEVGIRAVYADYLKGPLA